MNKVTPRSVRRVSVTATALALGGAMLIAAGAGAAAAAPEPAPAPTPTPAATLGHPDSDTMGSQIRLHEATDPSAPANIKQLRALATVAQPYGMDVSNYQGNINWPAQKAAGASFVYIKATESTTYQNSYFSQQYNGSYAAGLIRGAYHFAVPNQSSGAAQAAYFVAHGGAWSGDGHTLPPMLDIEYNPYGSNSCYGLTPTQMTSWIRDFSSTVFTKTGRYPTIYSSADWWNTCTGYNATFGVTNALFIARWASTPGVMPSGWSYHTFWQYSDHGTFPGDADVFNGSLSQLQAYATIAQGPTPTPTPPTTPADPVATYYSKLGGQSYLGAPLAVTYAVAGDRARDYQKGTIYYSAATGAHLVQGAILARYKALGGPTSTLGFPIGDQTNVGDGVGSFNNFSGMGRSSIYWSAKTGAHAVGGAIRAHWAVMGGPRGFLGYPLTDETATRGPGGRYNGFTGGAIIWTSALGAHELHGLIRHTWAVLKCETGPLGFPTSDVYSVAGGRRSNFVHGTVTWLAATGVAKATITH